MGHVAVYAPNGKCPAVGSWRQCGDGVEDGSRRKMFGRGGLEQDDVALRIPWSAVSTHALPMCFAAARHSPKATFPFRIHVATLICSYEAKRATSSPVNRSHTMAVEPAS